MNQEASEALEKALQDLMERDRWVVVERARKDMQDAHAQVRPTIEQIASMSGIEPYVILIAAVRTSWHQADLPWYRILAILRSFYVDKANIKKGEE